MWWWCGGVLLVGFVVSLVLECGSVQKREDLGCCSPKPPSSWLADLNSFMIAAARVNKEGRLSILILISTRLISLGHLVFYVVYAFYISVPTRSTGATLVALF